MKSREARRREARYLGIWMLGAVAALLGSYVLVEGLLPLGPRDSVQ